MKIIILAAGYGTRLLPLTENVPKPLVSVLGKPLLDYLVQNVCEIDHEEVFVVSNDKYYSQLCKWASGRSWVVLNDASKGVDDRLGSIGDINFAIQHENIFDDVLIVAGDNFFSASFKGLVDMGNKIRKPVLATYDVGSLEKVKSLSEICVDKNNKIEFFEEKPLNPKSSLVGIALYWCPKEFIHTFDEYIKEGNPPDHMGKWIEWLYKKTSMYAWELPGVWFDVGTHESLRETESFLKKNP